MKKLVPALSLLILLAACSKEEHISMRTEKITTGTWRLADFRSITTAGGTTTDTSLYSLLPTYQRDNRFRFLRDGNIATLEGQTRRLPDIPDSLISGRWAFSLADTKITLTDTTMAGLFDIQRFADSEMVFISKITGEDGSSLTASRIYKR